MDITEEQLIDLLENWARWCRSHRPQGRAGSAEGRYTAPRVKEDLTPGRPVDVLLAAAVERAVCKIGRKHRDTLKWSFVYPVPLLVICRKAGINRLAYSRYMREAKLMIRNQLLPIDIYPRLEYLAATTEASEPLPCRPAMESAR